MNLQVIEASGEYKAVIKNLMQFYIYDFSEFSGYDVEQDGQYFSYPSIDEYWYDKNKFPYIIKKDDKYVGFVFVRYINLENRSYFSIAEFFIMKKYRGQGIGRMVAMQIFNIYKGDWEVYQIEKNKLARLFWKKVITEYTNGQFTEHSKKGRVIQNFQSESRISFS